MRQIVMVAAMDERRALGYQQSLPWHLPDDFAHFKRTTQGKTVVFGYDTALSLGRPLPKRRSIVLSRTGRTPFAGMESARALEEVLALAGDQDLYVGGGGQVYSLFLPIATTMILTHVHTTVGRADTWFPDFSSPPWLEQERWHHGTDERHAFSFDVVTYRRP